MTSAPPHIRQGKVEDAQPLAAIYNHYVANTTATFQELPATADDFRHLLKNARVTRPFFCAEADGELVGYCYADLFKSRCGYRHTLESSVYVAAQIHHGGVGTALMAALLAALQSGDAQKLIAVIGLPNPSSVAFHQKLGFVHCGTLPGVGEKFGKSLDSGYWVKDLK